MRNNNGACWRMFAVAMVSAGVAPSAARATEAEVHNLTNESIWVVLAYNRSPKEISAGWYEVKKNEEKTFSAPDNQDMHIRIERRGKEVTYKNHDKFLSWPVCPGKRFCVHLTDTPKVRTLFSGPNLQDSVNVNTDDKLPAGWENRRFFHIGSGKHHFEVTP